MKLIDLRISCIKGANHIGIVFIAIIIGRSIATGRKTSNKWNVLQGMKGWWNLIMMTRREAIENLEYLISGECTDTQMDYVDEIQMAITDMKICDANNAGWISVKDRLPDSNRFVLVCNDDGHMMIAQYIEETAQWQYKYINYDVDVLDNEEQGPVCYWAYLPEPPKEG